MVCHPQTRMQMSKRDCCESEICRSLGCKWELQAERESMKPVAGRLEQEQWLKCMDALPPKSWLRTQMTGSEQWYTKVFAAR